MENSQGKIPIKIFIDKESFSVISCPSCNLIKRLDVSKFKGKTKPIKVTCKCGEKFTCKIEFRQFFRKATKLPGEFVVVGMKAHNRILVEDISQLGIGFTVIDPINVAIGDLLDITFTLDNRHRTVIRKRMEVKTIRDKDVGCEFAEKTGYDKELRFYLMP